MNKKDAKEFVSSCAGLSAKLLEVLENEEDAYVAYVASTMVKDFALGVLKHELSKVAPPERVSESVMHCDRLAEDLFQDVWAKASEKEDEEKEKQAEVEAQG